MPHISHKAKAIFLAVHCCVLSSRASASTQLALPCQGLGTGRTPRCRSVACWPAGLPRGPPSRAPAPRGRSGGRAGGGRGGGRLRAEADKMYEPCRCPIYVALRRSAVARGFSYVRALHSLILPASSTCVDVRPSAPPPLPRPDAAPLPRAPRTPTIPAPLAPPPHPLPPRPSMAGALRPPPR
jgi:hypothetical protein